MDTREEKFAQPCLAHHAEKQPDEKRRRGRRKITIRSRRKKKREEEECGLHVMYSKTGTCVLGGTQDSSLINMF